MPPLQQVVADNLRQIRHDQGLSQSELAFRAGIDRGSLSMLENGTLSVTVTVLDKLAHALRVEPAALLNSDLHRSMSRDVYRRIRAHRAVDVGIGRDPIHSETARPQSQDAGDPPRPHRWSTAEV